MQSTRFTIFHAIWLAGVPAAAYFTASIGNTHFGWFAAILFGIAGFIVAHILWCLLLGCLHRLFMMNIAAMKTEQLWKDVRSVSNKDWNMNETLKLLQLAARDEDVDSELPRIIEMLGSESRLERIYGWDAFRLVFTPQVELIEGYDPTQSADACRKKLAAMDHSPAPRGEQDSVERP